MKRKGFFYGFLIDLLIVALSYIICVRLKPGGSISYFKNYSNSFFLFLALWTLVSFALNKYNLTSTLRWIILLKKIVISNLFIFFIVTSMMYLFQSFNYSRFIVLGTVGVASIMEIFTGAFYMIVVKARVRYENDDSISTLAGVHEHLRAKIPIYHSTEPVPKPDFTFRYEYLKKEIGKDAFDYIFHYAALDSENTLIISTTTTFNIDSQIQPFFECIVNAKRINDFRFINKSFESVNAKLPIGGLFICHFETKDMRKQRILDKHPQGINYIYYSIDFIVKRVFPKFGLTKKLYFILTRGQNRVLSKAEAFGRLYSCGFEILDEKIIGRSLYFIAIKTKEPLFPKNPSYGPLIALERIGKGGKSIKVYKMRTMHPFAEYLQDYIYERVGLQEGGKFKDDFRITSLGKLMRKFWLDELPMLINLLKGDLKIVGVRPLSRQYFKLYSIELQKLRIQTKPGLIPPFYVDYPKTLDEIIESEIRYLRAYRKHKLQTDWVYFWKALYNIIFRRYRSK